MTNSKLAVVAAHDNTNDATLPVVVLGPNPENSSIPSTTTKVTESKPITTINKNNNNNNNNNNNKNTKKKKANWELH